MRSDGAIVFNTKIDNSDVDKDLRETKRKIEKSNKEIAQAESAKMPLLEDAKKLGVELDAAKEKLAQLQAQQSAAATALSGPDPAAYIEAATVKPEIDLSVSSQQKEVDRLQREWDKVNNKVDQYDQKIEKAKVSLAEQSAKAGELSAQLTKSGNGMAKAMAKVDASTKMIKKRLLSLALSALVFSVISEGLRQVRDYMGAALKSNEEYTAQLAKLKGALLTAFQPIYEFLVPALISLMKVATAAVQAVAHVAAFLGGKSVKEYAANAKALHEEAKAIEETGKAAKKAQKSLAGFDEINKLSGNAEDSTADSAMVAPDFSDFSTEEYAQKIDELTLILSGALLALGAILAFSGANIPLGIGLMALGAVGLATEAVMNWSAIVEALRGPIGAIVALASTALLALGLVLALSGAAIPLGVGLIVAGAAGLAITAAVNWDTIVHALQGPIGKITAIASAALLALGIILVCTGVIPLGVALIAAGAAGLVTVTAVNWNAIRDKVADVWSGIKQWWQSNVAPIFTSKYWENKFAVMGEALKNTWETAINTVIGLVNKFTAWLNDKLHLRWDAVSIAGVEVIPAVDYQLLSIPAIPKLAQGAVIPPNREFMAVLGDQRHGTNIEAPLETIQEAVAAVMADFHAGNMAGHEATVAVLKEILEAVLGIEIGDSVIGEAYERYRRKMAIAKGGA